MAHSKNLFDILAFGKCEVLYTRRKYSFCTINILSMTQGTSGGIDAPGP